MKTLIVATDFSKEAENALQYAGAAAQKLQGKVVIFNAFNISSHTGNSLFPASAVKEMIAYNNAILQRKADDLATEFGIEVHCESSMMELDEELDKAIEKHKADLVVMGMAPSSLSQDLFGNTTTSAIAKLKFPVLAIPAGVSFKGIKKILFACDILRGVEQEILNKIKTFAMGVGAQVEVFSVQNKLKALTAEHTARIDEGLQDIDYAYKNVVSTKVIQAIEDEVKAFEADILIMVPHKYSFWSSLVHQSKTRIMASRSEIPLLSIAL